MVDGQELWHCAKCDDWKLKREFHRYSKSPSRIYFYCKPCQNGIVRARYVPKVKA